ncbi:hypothetical protein ElyMa_003332100 [Elysia marginata]|uniref:Uncharacterized protein n=1 Tax=Elysia marginata TaxID=1093978 RepID=A0AAV4JEB1_9GAST|nr:hypothetical protein ElyMa_003332100 [Elysia marginata]
MKLLFALFLIAMIACAWANPDKRGLWEELQKEAAKILACEGTLDQSLCEDCCASTTWFHPSEQSACTTACAILP